MQTFNRRNITMNKKVGNPMTKKNNDGKDKKRLLTSHCEITVSRVTGKASMLHVYGDGDRVIKDKQALVNLINASESHKFEGNGYCNRCHGVGVDIDHIAHERGCAIITAKTVIASEMARRQWVREMLSEARRTTITKLSNIDSYFST